MASADSPLMSSGSRSERVKARRSFLPVIVRMSVFDRDLDVLGLESGPRNFYVESVFGADHINLGVLVREGPAERVVAQHVAPRAIGDGTRSPDPGCRRGGFGGVQRHSAWLELERADFAAFDEESDAGCSMVAGAGVPPLPFIVTSVYSKSPWDGMLGPAM